MSEDEKAKGSWWHTVPGTLTALSDVFTAVAGLLVALYQVGFIDLKGKSSAPSLASSSEPAKPLQEVTPFAADPVSATAPSKIESNTLKPSARNSAPHYLITFPSGTEATLANYASEATFKILAVEVSPKNTGNLEVLHSLDQQGKNRFELWQRFVSPAGRWDSANAGELVERPGGRQKRQRG